jgi:hypothetical protein
VPPHEAKLLLPAFHPTWAPQKFDFTQDFMGSSPFNPAILNVLDLALKRRRRCEASRGRSTISAATGKPRSQRGGCSVFSLGPLTYFEACTKFLVGRPLARNPSAANLGFLLKQLGSLAPMVVTYERFLHIKQRSALARSLPSKVTDLLGILAHRACPVEKVWTSSRRF